MSTIAPFIGRPAKPKVARLHDGRIGIFVGGAYQFTDDAGAASLRDQIAQILEPRALGDTPENKLARLRAYEETENIASCKGPHE